MPKTNTNTRVCSYNTTDVLPGVASDELIEASTAAAPTGAVLAYADEDGVWQHVPAAQRGAHRGVITVYVEG